MSVEIWLCETARPPRLLGYHHAMHPDTLRGKFFDISVFDPVLSAKPIDHSAPVTTPAVERISIEIKEVAAPGKPSRRVLAPTIDQWHEIFDMNGVEPASDRANEAAARGLDSPPPRRAEGGRLSGSFALVGEAGPEAIVPKFERPFGHRIDAVRYLTGSQVIDWDALS